MTSNLNIHLSIYELTNKHFLCAISMLKLTQHMKIASNSLLFYTKWQNFKGMFKWHVYTITLKQMFVFCKNNIQWTTVDWDSDNWMGQLPKPLYNCQNVTQMTMLLHFSPRHTSCEFHDILRTLRWFWKLSHSAVAVPHHCRPL